MLENLKIGDKVIATFKNKTKKQITVAAYRENIGAFAFYELPDVYYMGGNIGTTITDRDIIKIEPVPEKSPPDKIQKKCSTLHQNKKEERKLKW